MANNCLIDQLIPEPPEMGGGFNSWSPPPPPLGKGDGMDLVESIHIELTEIDRRMPVLS